MTGSRRRLLKTGMWNPPAAPPNQGRTTVTTAFTITARFHTDGEGPEDVAFDHDGQIVTGLVDGRIVRIDPITGDRTIVGSTGGRPLGVQPSRDRSVLICDHDKGLLRMSSTGKIDVLVDEIDGAPLRFASNVTEHADGTIWFTVSSRRWDLENYLGDVFEHSCTGLLVQRDPDGTLTVLLDRLKFANGLTLAPDQTHLLFAETEGYRVSRYWLTGTKIGTVEPLIDNLPGLPDNISLGSDALVWVSIAAPRNALLDRLLPRFGLLRTLLWNLPIRVRPKATPIAWVMAFDLHGRVIYDLRSDDGCYDFVTSVAEYDSVVVAGSLHATDIVHIALPPK
ncbi:SMP-30/gluconolactonase/LRE family protein [Mycolicibacterium sp. HK-90]|uniref:SMP-30/gluconolactonase/LRE family protein n=1 Tax=Mycolicibacterium sp. HK-90 TaxID=3056937 RepID=UPI00265ADA87|nr:SMP-30/gluconolactonase/LRE family protein [Mycolicibacterium sp. HK-90]WKG04029.1 SMP-30/gluconolactonase/LRE family protein [Mycolicibacterium sp. HK-90]